MHSVLLTLHIIVAIALVSLVLIQHGKGADAGAAFGSGASATVFGARGAANFLTRTSAVLAIAFFITSLSLAYFSVREPQRASSITQIEEPKVADENMVIPPLPKEKTPEEIKSIERPQKAVPSKAPAESSDVPDLPSGASPAEP